MTVTLTEADSRFILEALQDMYARWMEINRTSTDEDEQAEYGMDAVVLNMTREAFEHCAVDAFGEGVKNFSREPIVSDQNDLR
jgi:hypothetical protein